MRPSEKGPRKFRLHRGRVHTPRPPADPPCPLSPVEVNMLGNYNAEVSRGLVHTEHWHAEMGRLQRRYSRWLRDCADTYNAWQAGISVAEYRRATPEQMKELWSR